MRKIKDELECAVCDGAGKVYIDGNGTRRDYYLECPHCYGTGRDPELEEAAAQKENEEELEWPPASTASTISHQQQLDSWGLREFGRHYRFYRHLKDGGRVWYSGGVGVMLTTVRIEPREVVKFDPTRLYIVREKKVAGA